MVQSHSLIGPARDQAARGDVAVHDHLCGIYETTERQYEPACRFMRAGLERGEQCLYIAERMSPAEFARRLEAHGVDVARASKGGSLVIASGAEVRSALGGFTPARMLGYLAERATSARAAGFTALRLGADMTWLRQPDIAPVDLFSYEAELNLLLQSHEVVALCQYSREHFESEGLVAMAETHPLLVYDDLVCDNFYYVPPEEYRKPRFSDQRLQRMLFNIISRERMMHDTVATDLPPINVAAVP